MISPPYSCIGRKFPATVLAKMDRHCCGNALMPFPPFAVVVASHWKKYRVDPPNRNNRGSVKVVHKDG